MKQGKGAWNCDGNALLRSRPLILPLVPQRLQIPQCDLQPSVAIVQEWCDEDYGCTKRGHAGDLQNMFKNYMQHL